MCPVPCNFQSLFIPHFVAVLSCKDFISSRLYRSPISVAWGTCSNFSHMFQKHSVSQNLWPGEKMWKGNIEHLLKTDILQSCGSIAWPWNMSIMFCGVLRIFTYYLRWHLAFWVELYSQHFFRGIIIYLNIINRKYCSSRYNSLKILFKAAVSLKIPTQFITCTNANFFLFPKIISMKVR